ncbi:uncharacterized protein ppp1r3c2a isoform X4 [Sparus aurata]|uniref:uncharacterized protein ppp1r3c2a isoform X4 n=1 Tax=Sparus aurata TaxID=8175 RepID=UPI0011C19E45|nr:uncharacterized protein LOC115592345 isoform X4 [Sparus aurata]
MSASRSVLQFDPRDPRGPLRALQAAAIFLPVPVLPGLLRFSSHQTSSPGLLHSSAVRIKENHIIIVADNYQGQPHVESQSWQQQSIAITRCTGRITLNLVQPSGKDNKVTV